MWVMKDMKGHLPSSPWQQCPECGLCWEDFLPKRLTSLLRGIPGAEKSEGSLGNGKRKVRGIEKIFLQDSGEMLREV